MSRQNGLDDAHLERLVLLSEEMGEVQQAIGKIIRFGYDNKHMMNDAYNREVLEKECGDVLLAIRLLTEHDDIRSQRVENHRKIKLLSFFTHLHYNHGWPKPDA